MAPVLIWLMGNRTASEFTTNTVTIEITATTEFALSELVILAV